MMLRRQLSRCAAQRVAVVLPLGRHGFLDSSYTLPKLLAYG